MERFGKVWKPLKLKISKVRITQKKPCFVE